MYISIGDLIVLGLLIGFGSLAMINHYRIQVKDYYKLYSEVNEKYKSLLKEIADKELKEVLNGLDN